MADVVPHRDPKATTAAAAATPAAGGYRMPPESGPHERTLMSWPCRRELWGDLLEDAKREYAVVADAVAAFEPVTLVAADASDAAEARRVTGDGVEVVQMPLDDSWMRDNGPIFATGGPEGRIGVHFGFNAWGGKFAGWERDVAAGAALAARYGATVVEAPFVLEGGSILVDAAGRLVTTEQCLLHPNRNPTMTRQQIEQGLRDYLGVTEIVWLGRGLVGDRDTDGHVDMCAALTDDGALLLQSRPPGDPDHVAMAENRRRAEAAGLRVIEFPPLATGRPAGEDVTLSYLNLYLCNGGVVVPLAGTAEDDDALARLRDAYPDRQVVGVPALTIAAGGGGPHCITQQVPAVTRAAPATAPPGPAPGRGPEVT